MPDIEFKLTATDEATPVIERVRRELDRFSKGYSSRMGGSSAPGGSSASAKQGGGSFSGSMFGKGVLGGLASLTVIGAGIKLVLGKISQTLIQASPMLQAVTNDMKNAITLYIRPYGDKLAKILAPMSEAMIEDAAKSAEWNEQNPDAMPWMDPTLPGNKSRKKLFENLDVDELNDELNFFGQKAQQSINSSMRKVGKWFDGLFKGSAKVGTASMSMTGDIGSTAEGDGPDSGWTWENIVAPMSNFGHWLMNSITSGIGDLATTVGGFGTWLYEGMTGWWGDDEDSTLGGFAGWLLGKVTAPFSNLGTTLGGFGTWLDEHIKTPLSGIGESIGGFGTWLWEQITSSLGGVAGSLSGFGSWLWSSITTPMGGIGGTLSGFGSWLWGTVTGGFGSVGSTISGFGSWLWGKITSPFGNVGTSLGGFGTWVFNEMKRALSGLAKTIGGIPATLWNGMRTALQAINIEILGKTISPFDFIPAMEVGGSVLKTGAAIVHEGENVLTKQQSRMMRNGGTGMSSPPIEVHIHGNVYGVSDLERAIDEAVSRAQMGYAGYR